MGPLRHQLPVYSPLPPGALLAASAPGRADPRPALEAWLREAYAADDVVLCQSGGAALRLALAHAQADALLTTGGPPVVALPAFTCYDVGAAAVGADAQIALYDVDPGTLAPDPDSLERVLAAGARVVVVAPLYGVPVDWEAIEERAARHGAELLEDAAQGHGAAWRERPLGSLGRRSIISFGRGKGWTGGGGGALLVRRGAGVPEGWAAGGPEARVAGRPDSGTAGRPESRAADGRPDARADARTELRILLAALAQWALGRPSLYALPMAVPGLGLGETHYHEIPPPAAMPRVAAALVAASRVAAEREAAARRRNARAYLERLPGGLAAGMVRPESGGTPGWLRFPLRIAGGMAGLDEPGRALRLGIAPSYPKPLSRLPQVAGRLTGPERRWPGAEALARELLTLPTHSRLAARERDAVVRMVSRRAAVPGGAPAPALR